MCQENQGVRFLAEVCLLAEMHLLVEVHLLETLQYSRLQGLSCKYTLPQKKRRLNPAIFPIDPGSLTLTQCHVNFVKWS